MSSRWDQKGVPHKGWHCVGMEDLGRADGNCEMCGREEIRYVHYMEHPEYDGTISAGCICAEKMESGYRGSTTPPGARDRERSLRNVAARRTRWLGLMGWRLSKNGNPHISKDGFHIVTFEKKGRFKFLIEIVSENEKYFSRRGYPTVEEAQLAAFDAMMFLKGERGQ